MIYGVKLTIAILFPVIGATFSSTMKLSPGFIRFFVVGHKKATRKVWVIQTNIKKNSSLPNLGDKKKCLQISLDLKKIGKNLKTRHQQLSQDIFWKRPKNQRCLGYPRGRFSPFFSAFQPFLFWGPNCPEAVQRQDCEGGGFLLRPLELGKKHCQMKVTCKGSIWR